MGFSSVVSIVVGSQIGSGIFMLPASLALIGPISLFGWLISGSGAILLALVFAQLCIRLPNASGPHAYVGSVFGKNTAFFVGWTYWLISWISSVAVIVATVGYLSPLLGVTSSFAILFLEIFLLFLITILNMKGVAFVGLMEFVLTLFKCIPLLIIPLVSLMYFNPDFLKNKGEHSLNIFGSINKASLLTMWGFIGLETVTVASGVVNNPKKIIPQAVIFGTLAVAAIYVLNSIGIMGVIDPAVLANESAPYSTASEIIFGSWCTKAVSLIATIACIGTLNAWVLTSGQIAYKAAKDGLFPQFFGKTNKQSAPYVSLLIAFVGSIPFLMLTLNESLVAQVNAIIDISVTTFLFIYIACIVSFLILLKRDQKKNIFYWASSIFAMGFCFWALLSISLFHLFMSFLFVLSGLPIYLFQYKMIRTEKVSKQESS